MSIRALGPAFRKSSPSRVNRPAVGSVSRDRQRSRVDLPEPERPISTKNSPRLISISMSQQPTMWPSALRLSARAAASAPLAPKRPARSPSPKTFQSCAQASVMSRLSAISLVFPTASVVGVRKTRSSTVLYLTFRAATNLSPSIKRNRPLRSGRGAGPSRRVLHRSTYCAGAIQACQVSGWSSIHLATTSSRSVPSWSIWPIMACWSAVGIEMFCKIS